MDKPAAFEANYHTVRVVHGRGVIQVVLEVPIERWDLINSVLGPPKSGDTWVAVAKIMGPEVAA